MNHEGKWVMVVHSPLGEESYDLTLNSDMTGCISHPKGEINFSNAKSIDKNTFEITGNTDVPMTTDFKIRISNGTGILFLGDFAKIDVSLERA